TSPPGDCQIILLEERGIVFSMPDFGSKTHGFQMLYENTVAADIVAMKLNAITRRSTKKDFFDIAELLDHYTLQEMLQFFTDKYAATDIGFVVRSLTYFEGAETSKDPIQLNKMDWKQVKMKIQQAVKDYWRG
ncbi:MAG: nucleotidyl transferase AbiEii/AbiGii toxin family protein, partial [Saprospiraceae bacterium]